MVPDRTLVAHRHVRIDRRIVRIDADPGFYGGKTAISCAVPLHRRAGVVAAVRVGAHDEILRRTAGIHMQLIHVERLDIAVLLDRAKRHVGHADFLALIDERRAFQQMQDRRQHLGGFDGIARSVTIFRNGTRQVMIAPEQGIPAIVGQRVLPFAQHRLQFDEVEGFRLPFAVGFIPLAGHVFELEHHREFLPLATGIEKCRCRCGTPRLADGQDVAATEGLAVHRLQIFVQVRTIGHHALVHLFADIIDDIHPETGNAAFQPPVHHVMNFGTDLRVFPVQIGLAAREEMQVVFAGRLVERPGGAAECRLEIVGRSAVRTRLAPDVEVTKRIVERGS